MHIGPDDVLAPKNVNDEELEAITEGPEGVEPEEFFAKEDTNTPSFEQGKPRCILCY